MSNSLLTPELIPDRPSSKSKLKTGLRQWGAVFPYVILGFIGIAVFVIYPMIRIL